MGSLKNLSLGHLSLHNHHDGGMDQQTNRWADKASYRVACPQLKNGQMDGPTNQQQDPESHVLDLKLLQLLLKLFFGQNDFVDLELKSVFMLPLALF